jgi:hypothetical protein
MGTSPSWQRPSCPGVNAGTPLISTPPHRHLYIICASNNKRHCDSSHSSSCRLSQVAGGTEKSYLDTITISDNLNRLGCVKPPCRNPTTHVQEELDSFPSGPHNTGASSSSGTSMVAACIPSELAMAFSDDESIVMNCATWFPHGQSCSTGAVTSTPTTL